MIHVGKWANEDTDTADICVLDSPGLRNRITMDQNNGDGSSDMITVSLDDIPALTKALTDLYIKLKGQQ